jgi:hypothetical protein
MDDPLMPPQQGTAWGPQSPYARTLTRVQILALIFSGRQKLSRAIFWKAIGISLHKIARCNLMGEYRFEGEKCCYLYHFLNSEKRFGRFCVGKRLHFFAGK